MAENVCDISHSDIRRETASKCQTIAELIEVRQTSLPYQLLGISAVRGGTITGTHDVIFAGTDEVITLSHMAYSRAVFAKGSVVAAKFMKGKEAGYYDMADVLM